MVTFLKKDEEVEIKYWSMVSKNQVQRRKSRYSVESKTQSRLSVRTPVVYEINFRTW